MDFSRLGSDTTYTRQFAEQLLQNTLFRDAAVKANQADEAKKDEQTKTAAAGDAGDSGLDNLLGALTSALQSAGTVDNAAAPEANESQNLVALLNHPSIQQALQQLPLESSLSLKVLVGQIPPEAAERALELVSTIPADTVTKVGATLQNLSSDDLNKGVNFFQALFSERNDRVFSQGDNREVYLNNSNSRSITGAELNEFLRTAYYVQASGSDIGKFLDQATDVINRGDYDDLDSFLSTVDMVMYKQESVDQYLDFSKDMLDKSAHDFESNNFQLHMTMAYGGRMQNYIDISKNLETTGAEGRNNLVDLTRITVDFRDAGGYVPVLYQALADEANEGGDVRAFMNDYMAVQGIADTSPDFNKFDRIERIDGDPMTIKEGESAALFAQAISTRDGLLPESVLFWSSVETGALGNGSSYMDLSTLPPGTYNIGVKIGNYAGGTDTAFKKVIVEAADTGGETTTTPTTAPVLPEVVLPESGQLKISLNPGSASLRSDLYIQKNGGEPELVAENAQQGGDITLTTTYNAGDKVDFLIRTFPSNGGEAYEHSTNGPGFEGRSYASVSQTSDTMWSVGFEDLPGASADWDLDDVKLTVELLKITSGGSTDEVDEELIVGGGGTTVAAPQPYSAEETADITRSAIDELGTGASVTDVAEALNARYYASVDAQVSSNQSYTQLIEDARSDSGQLRTVLEQVLQELTGEVPAANNTGAPEVNQGETYYNPYF